MPRRYIFSDATGGQLRALRLELGWTQAKFSRLLHITIPQYSRYENGHAPIPAQTWELAVYKVAHLLDRPPQELGAI